MHIASCEKSEQVHQRVFRNFHILKINRMTPVCNLFMERAPYITLNTDRPTSTKFEHIKQWSLNYKMINLHDQN